MSTIDKIDDNISKRPEDYGFCSFSEFRKNKSKWIAPKDQLLQCVDNGSTDYAKIIGDQRYYLNGYRCTSLEAVESLANEMGFGVDKVVSSGIVKEKIDNGKLRLHIHFMDADTFEKRKTW